MQIGEISWGRARMAVTTHLENRPSCKFRNIVRDAQRKFLRRDKDNHILNQLSEDVLQSTRCVCTRTGSSLAALVWVP